MSNFYTFTAQKAGYPHHATGDGIAVTDKIISHSEGEVFLLTCPLLRRELMVILCRPMTGDA